MPQMQRAIHAFFCTSALLVTMAHARNRGIDASRCLETRPFLHQQIGNVFSRTIAFRVEGFDEFVKRVSGTGMYTVAKLSPQAIVFDSSFRYDGNPVSSGQTVVKDNGRTICWKTECSLATDASGVSINPLFWGAPKGHLHVGQSWQVDIAIPWELGPPGRQTVTVVSLEPANDSITLERQGEGNGDSLAEIKKLPLVKGKKTYIVSVAPGKTTWSGYTTFQRGFVLSDVLIVQKPVTVTSRDLGQSSGWERQYILLNAAPPALLRN